MIELTPAEIAQALPALKHTVSDGEGEPFAARAEIDSRLVEPGSLFFGLSGEHVDGGKFAVAAIEAGAWGVVVASDSAAAAAEAAQESGRAMHVFSVEDPLSGLAELARAWRRRLGARVVGVTGSTGKTSTKDILAALLARSRRVVATPENFNTEIGLPLSVLGAPADTELLVLEMAMRGRGQIAELTRIAEPDVGCIVNVGPVHLELLGSVEEVAAAKAELINGLPAGATCVTPAGEPLLSGHLRADLHSVSFGEGGDVRLLSEDAEGELTVATPAGEVRIHPSFTEPYLRQNLLAAIACAQALEVPVDGELAVEFSALRGEIHTLADGVTLINDCYNANPVSMRAALENLARADGRRVAVLGGMMELGEDSVSFHRAVGAEAETDGVSLLIAVGELADGYHAGFSGRFEHVESPEAAAALLKELIGPGDTVLVKGSRSVGLERVAEALTAGEVTG